MVTLIFKVNICQSFFVIKNSKFFIDSISEYPENHAKTDVYNHLIIQL